MKKALFSALLAAFICLAPMAAAAQMQHGTPATDNTQDQFQAFRQAKQEQWKKTAELRQQVVIKKHELAALWVNPKTTQEELLRKQRELQDARAAMEREQISFMFRMKQQGFDFDHYGMGQGMMDGYGMGQGMMGHGMTGDGMMGQGMMGGGMGSGMMGHGPMGKGMMGHGCQ